MNKSLLFLQLVLVPFFSTQAWKGDPFEKILKDYDLNFSFSKNYKAIPTKENPNLFYDFAIKHKMKKLEIRYFIGLPAPKMDGVDFEKTELYKAQALTTAANVCQCMDKIRKNEFESDTLSLFNANWGANFFLEPASEFGKGFKSSIVTALHKKDLPDLYTIYLFDDFESVKLEIQEAAFNLKFKQDSTFDKSFRGISFVPTEQQIIKNMTISIPTIANRSETTHITDKYPITFFKADCVQKNECFSFLISISIIPEEIKTYEQIIQDSKTTEFDKPPSEMTKWTEVLNFKTEKTMILLGPGSVMGTKVIAFYYLEDIKETYRINTNLIYYPNFSYEDWKDIVTHTFLILNSVSIKK